MRVRRLLASGFLAAGISALGLGALAGPASAHDLHGGAEQGTCVDGSVPVTWNFTVTNAGDSTITTVEFSRSVVSSGHGDISVHALTNETPGTTVSLSATVTFTDGFIAGPFTVTTTIPTDICPVPTTTTVPPTTTTVPPVTTTAPPVTTTAPPFTTTPTTTPAQPTTTVTVEDVVAAPGVAPRQAPTTAAAALPTTGSSSTTIVAVGVAALLVGGALLLAGRRGSAA